MKSYRVVFCSLFVVFSLCGLCRSENAVKYREPFFSDKLKDFVAVHIRDTVEIFAKNNLTADNADLLQRFVAVDEKSDEYCLETFRYLAHNPYKFEGLCRLLTDDISANVGNLRTLCFRAFAWNAVAGAENNPLTELPAKEAGILTTATDSIDEVLKQMEAYLQACSELQKEAFANITEEEMDFVVEKREALLQSFLTYKMLRYEPNKQIVADSSEICRILNKINMQALQRQQYLALSILDKDYLAHLKEVFQKHCPKMSEQILVSRETPYGNIVIAGTSDNIHTGDCAILIDFGGDDLYLNNQGSSLPKTIPTAALIDYEGNDSYESTDSLTQGAGNFGVGILADLSGNDKYIGIFQVQGVSFGGAGLLYDASGDDTYRGIAYAQGASFFGSGILADAAGNDRYEAQQHSQAIGFPRGIGLIADISGDDFYYCKGGEATGYGTRGHFEGWGQGMGFGIRAIASGGIGVLYDMQGRDHFEAGAFAQGGGYYYALGFLYNGGGEDDVYIGTRYAQGFGCHQGFGALIDIGGNDVYKTTSMVACGLAWDEGMGLLIDQGGDDRYDAGWDFGICAVAMNGIHFFRDYAGKDTYTIKAATAKDNSYHGGTSLGIFIDEGGDEDVYAGRENNSIAVEPTHAIFIDR